MLFSPQAHKIDRISIGCIVSQYVGLCSLDSYQEHDLNKLRDKCRSFLEQRKHYLHSQLTQLSDSQKDEDKERYESLCKQLANLGDEQAAVDAPGDDSHLPGATLQWNPLPGMEEHIPIVFMDLNEDELSGNWSNESNNSSIIAEDTDQQMEDQYFYDTEEYFSRENPEPKPISSKKTTKQYQLRRIVKTVGEDSLLKFEKTDDYQSSYLDLKIVNWNDSSAVEVQDASENTYVDELKTSSEPGKLVLRATAQWDSSEHKSKHLNKETPLDEHVYLIVKINVKFKLNLIDSSNGNSDR